MVAHLPQNNYNAIKRLVRMLVIISRNSEVNKMTSLNLGIVFGPNLVKSSSNSANFLIEVKMQAEFATRLIIDYQTFFPDLDIPPVPTLSHSQVKKN